MIETPGFVAGVYVLVGLFLYYWSEPYRPKSAAAFDACFRHHRGVWFVMVLLASLIWPIILCSMAYRFFFTSSKGEGDDADR